MPKTALERKVARPEVQEMMGVRHVAAVFVHRCVAYRVARHADTARKSKSMCEKCCEVSWSESWAAAEIRFLRLSERRCAPCSLSDSPVLSAYLSSSKSDTAS